jgi:hypothetical protein
MKRRPTYLALALFLLPIATGAMLLKPENAGEDMTKAAHAFLGSLSEEQRTKAVMEFDDKARLDWHFIPKDHRKGLQLREMSEPQQKAARALLAACLSELGSQKAETIMDLEQILHKLEAERKTAKLRRDYLRYYFTVFGTPRMEGKWGLSIEGHHLSLNFVVENGKLSSDKPAFFGANPALVKDEYGIGPKKGTRVLAAEEQLAFKLLHSLSGDQRKQAVTAKEAPRDIRGAGDPQPPHTAPAGVPASMLDESQLGILRALLKATAEKMRGESSERDLKAIEEAGIEKVHFAWEGADREGIGHYYRLQGPTFLVEFCNNQPDSAGNPANHIHMVWRDPLHGDFGVPIKKASK